MPADVRAELEYMAQHVTAGEFRAAALAEVARMQTELQRLRAIEQRAQTMTGVGSVAADTARYILTGDGGR